MASIGDIILEKFKEEYWTTYSKQRIKIKDLSSDHLINIIHHIQVTNCFSKETLKKFLLLAKERNLSKDDLNRAQIPHTDENGDLVKMSYKKENLFKMEKVK